MRSKQAIALIVANGFFLAVLFPYVSPVPTPYDTQPWALALSLLILTMFLGSGRFLLPCPLWALLISFIYAALIFSFNRGPMLGALRSLVGYASVFCIAGAAYLTARWLRPKVFVGAVLIWALVGFIQLTVYKEFGQQLVPRLSTSAERGVTSLAVEPSYYAITAVFFLAQ